MDLKLCQSLVGYSLKLHATIALACVEGSTSIIEDKVFVPGLVLTFLFVIVCRVSFCTKHAGMEEWRLHVGINSISPFSMSCTGVVVSNGALLSDIESNL